MVQKIESRGHEAVPHVNEWVTASYRSAAGRGGSTQIVAPTGRQGAARGQLLERGVRQMAGHKPRSAIDQTTRLATADVVPRPRHLVSAAGPRAATECRCIAG